MQVGSASPVSGVIGVVLGEQIINLVFEQQQKHLCWAPEPLCAVVLSVF